MFLPPRCPYRGCAAHERALPDFYRRLGHYRAKCRPHPIPRFACKLCGRSFSRQTFRMDYRDHRPDLNARLFQSIASGVGLRQTARNLGLSLRCCELKYRKIARHLRRLNLNLRAPLPEGSKLQLDELETFEGRRNTRPLSVPVLIESRSRYLVWAESATIRPRGRMSEARRRAIAEDEARYGIRRDNSRAALRRTLRRGAEIAGSLALVPLATDEKASYRKLAEAAFGKRRLVHSTTSSKIARDVANPLFPINHTEAMARDLLGRLRRDSWLVSKKRRYLDLALALYAAYRNLARVRFNYDERTPAELVGFAPRRLRVGELLGWRQDWGRRSIHPLARRAESVANWLPERLAAEPAAA
jgi:transposase-like protein